MTMKNSKTVIFFLLLSLMLSGCEKGEILVETGEVSDILTTTATVTGNILSIGDGIKQYGHCFATIPNPVVSGSKRSTMQPLEQGPIQASCRALNPEPNITSEHTGVVKILQYTAGRSVLPLPLRLLPDQGEYCPEFYRSK